MTKTVALCGVCMNKAVYFTNRGTCKQCNLDAVEHNYIEKFTTSRIETDESTGETYVTNNYDKMDMFIVCLLAEETFMINPMDYGDMLRRIQHNGLEDTFANIHRVEVELDDDACPVGLRLSLNEEIAIRNGKEDEL